MGFDSPIVTRSPRRSRCPASKRFPRSLTPSFRGLPTAFRAGFLGLVQPWHVGRREAGPGFRAQLRLGVPTFGGGMVCVSRAGAVFARPADRLCAAGVRSPGRPRFRRAAMCPAARPSFRRRALGLAFGASRRAPKPPGEPRALARWGRLCAACGLVCRRRASMRALMAPCGARGLYRFAGGGRIGPSEASWRLLAGDCLARAGFGRIMGGRAVHGVLGPVARRLSTQRARLVRAASRSSYRLSRLCVHMAGRMGAAHGVVSPRYGPVSRGPHTGRAAEAGPCPQCRGPCPGASLRLLRGCLWRISLAQTPLDTPAGFVPFDAARARAA